MSDQEQKTRDEDAAKSRKGLNLSVNVNTILTAVVGLIVTGMWTDLRSAHDDLLTLKATIPAIVEKVNSNTDSIKSLWRYVSRGNEDPHQVPTQDN